jgi:hypothetical protein
VLPPPPQPSYCSQTQAVCHESCQQFSMPCLRPIFQMPCPPRTATLETDHSAAGLAGTSRQFINRGWMTFQDLLQCLFGLAMSGLGAGDVSKLFTDQVLDVQARTHTRMHARTHTRTHAHTHAHTHTHAGCGRHTSAHNRCHTHFWVRKSFRSSSLTRHAHKHGRTDEHERAYKRA